jgi:putative restriction endonuclease
MTPDDLRRRVATLRTNVHRGRRAPHKPLLLLWALARFAEGHERLAYARLEPAVNALLDDFGPPYRTTADMPFWHLQSDGVWVVEDADALPPGKGQKKPLVTTLREREAVGSLAPDVRALLRDHPELVGELAGLLLDHFPRTYHEDLLHAVGWEARARPIVGETPSRYRTSRRPRDPDFRARVLDAYDAQCAVCGFSATLADHLVGLDAAHIQWHSEDGPDETANGLALCVLHHTLFDRGAFTLSVDPERRVEVAVLAKAPAASSALLLDLHGQPLRRPSDDGEAPDSAFVRWHRSEVFRKPARPPSPPQR